MQRIFQILDLNKDGVLSSEDWDMYVHYAMNQKQLKERQHVRFMKLFQRVKPLLLPDGSKTLRENFASCCVALVTQGDHIEQYGNLWFTMMDSSGDEEISFDEWMKFNTQFDIDRDHAAKSFDALDEDKDGFIDRVEFLRNYVEFWRVFGWQ
ncbi:hypothetical protein EMCRGX_G000785 [Ephydatia muelleri]